MRAILAVYEGKLVDIFGTIDRVPVQYSRMSSMVRFMRKQFIGSCSSNKLMAFTVSIMICLAMDELEDATVSELSAQLDLERLQSLQQVFRTLQRNFVINTKTTSSAFRIDNKARAFAVIDGMLAYASVKRLRRILRCPTLEEVGEDMGFWSAQEKITALNCELQMM